MEPFNRYRTIDIIRAVVDSGCAERVTLMTGNDGYVACPEDSLQDQTTLVTFGVYDVGPDTGCVVKILATSTSDPGGASLRIYIDQANAFIDNHVEIACPVETGCTGCVPGDANGDNTVNVGDAVYVINYVFKNGPPPTPWTKCNGDANGDCSCNVGDAVYIINYVFKNGPNPKTLPEYEGECLPECGDYVGP